MNAALKARGLLTWFDDEKMRGQILDQMASGVNRSATVAVFITKRYLEKVNGDKLDDNCKVEFKCARARAFAIPGAR